MHLFLKKSKKYAGIRHLIPLISRNFSPEQQMIAPLEVVPLKANAPGIPLPVKEAQPLWNRIDFIN